MTKIGPLPVVTENTITEPGWYWFEPAHPGMVGGFPKFVQIADYAIKEGWLKCRRYAGRYAGPIEPPDMSPPPCKHRGGEIVRQGDPRTCDIRKCELCQQEYMA